MASRLTTLLLLMMVVVCCSPARAEEPETTGAKRSKWALVVGVSEFKDVSLNNPSAANNARAFEEYLTTKAHFPREHVKTLLDKQATREAILMGTGMDLGAAEKDDLVVVYLSSEGSSPNLDYGKIAYLMASDSDKERLYATGVALNSIAKILEERNRSINTVVITDCDYSGNAVEKGNQSSRQRDANRASSSPIVISAKQAG